MFPPGIRFKSKFLILYHTSRYGWYLPFCHVGHYGIPFNFVLLKILAIPAHTSPYQLIPACTGQVFKYQQKEEYRAKSFSERLNIAIFFFFHFSFVRIVWSLELYCSAASLDLFLFIFSELLVVLSLTTSAGSVSIVFLNDWTLLSPFKTFT